MALRAALTHATEVCQGFRAEAQSSVSEMRGAGRWVGRMFSSDVAERTATRAEARSVVDYVRQNPNAAAANAWQSVAEPVREEFRAGRPGAGVGRGLWFATSALLPGVGAEKAGRVGAAARSAIDDPRAVEEAASGLRELT